MQPLRQRLGNTHKLLLSPDSQLNLIPFAALVAQNNHYLLESYDISYLGSGRDLLRQKNHYNSKLAPVVFADPDFDHLAELKLAPIASSSRGITSQRAADLTALYFGKLDDTATEANTIKPLLPGAKLLTGSFASKQALLSLHGPSVLHLATHGFFLSVPPTAPPTSAGLGMQSAITAATTSSVTSQENSLLRSGLALAGANLLKSGNANGILTSLEASGLDLRGTKLVVLSACETGLGDVVNGEGVYGLRRAFVLAGAETQVISLWQVADRGTKDLMFGYYTRLRRSGGRSDALRQTQLQMLRSQEYQHPYYWAAFIPSGDWRSMDVQPK